MKTFVDRTFSVEAGQGPPIVLLHGAAASGSAWKEIIPCLSDSHRVIVPDIVGHGKSQSPGSTYTRKFYTAWLRGFLLGKDIPKVTLIGHSLGGSVALSFTLEHPGMVVRLILVDSIGLGMPRTEATLLLLGALVARSDDRAVQLMTKVMFYNPAKIQAEAIISIAGEKEGVTRGWRGFFQVLSRTWAAAMPLSARQLEKITVPVHLVWGEHDSYFPIAHAYRAARVIHHAVVKPIPNSGHVPFIEKPQEFLEAVREVT